MLMYVRLLLDTRLTHSRCVYLSSQVTTVHRYEDTKHLRLVCI